MQYVNRQKPYYLLYYNHTEKKRSDKMIAVLRRIAEALERIADLLADIAGK